MIQVNNLEVFNFEGAFRGLRNPMNSWEKSDSDYCDKYVDYSCKDCIYYKYDSISDDYPLWECLYPNRFICKKYRVGKQDLELAQRMIHGGTDESKFMRQILVSMDITAPLYWWKEMDTYKVATVANSTSTMHKISSKPIEISDFSHDEFDIDDNYSFNDYMFRVIKDCEELRQKYIETKDKKYWRGLIQLLPESYNQKRTWTANYQVLRNIYFARRHHKLDEWKEFCKIIETLPYGKELICYE